MDVHAQPFWLSECQPVDYVLHGPTGRIVYCQAIRNERKFCVDRFIAKGSIARELLEALVDFLFEEISKNSIAYLVIESWGPPVLTIVVGGLFASILFPRWQAQYNRGKALGEHKIKLYEEIAEHFSLYIAAWRRLISIARLEKRRKLSEREMNRKEQFVLQRNDYRDTLISEFARAKLYFSAKSRIEIEDFMKWDEANGTKTVDELPTISEWQDWEERVVQCLRKELRIR
ncbi:MAG: hypothetical protein ACFB03_04950 [Paracoccaceae bacterium]